MIGTAEEAKFIRDWAHGRAPGGYIYGDEVRKNLPEGWQYAGCGAYRAAFLSPCGVIYKVEREVGGNVALWGQSNEGEYRNLKKMYLTCKLPEGTRLPKFTYYTLDNNGGVMAMEAIDTKYADIFDLPYDEQDRIRSLYNKLQDQLPIGDLHHANVMYDSKTKELVPVDCAG